MISEDWIRNVSKANRKADKILVEKVIRAFLLLEGLVKQNLEFVFKGGTALMLHLNSTKRLSIDIDIVLPKRPDDFNLLLDKLATEQGFLRTEIQHRSTDNAISKEHYKFFYKPLHKTNKEEEYVLLDVLLETANYQELMLLPVESSFVPFMDAPFLVTTPPVHRSLKQSY